ncbi:kinase-like protein [Peniophora sp. CONT]|nr:kinase-like protein [Peniophora sp. CONT]
MARPLLDKLNEFGELSALPTSPHDLPRGIHVLRTTKRQYFIGRSIDNQHPVDVQIDSSKTDVGRLHAVVEWDDALGMAFLRDLNSLNGTYTRQRSKKWSRVPTQGVPLKRGDTEIKMGPGIADVDGASCRLLYRNLFDKSVFKKSFHYEHSAGVGQHGEVIKCWQRDNPMTVRAVKLLRYGKNPAGLTKLRNEAMAEPTMLSQAQDCPYICHYYEHIDDPELHTILLVMEYHSLGDLYSGLGRNGPIGDGISRVVIAHVCLGVKFLQEVLSVVHCDIQPRNVLVASSGPHWRFLICDLSMAVRLPDSGTAQGRRGTWRYAAPEVYLEGRISKLADSFSIGILGFNLALGLGECPYTEIPELYAEDEEQKWFMSRRLRWKAFGARASTECAEVMRSLLQKDPGRRATILEVMQAKWLSTGETLTAIVPDPVTGSRRSARLQGIHG